MPKDAHSVLCGQLTHDLFVTAKFLFMYVSVMVYILYGSNVLHLLCKTFLKHGSYNVNAALLLLQGLC